MTDKTGRDGSTRVLELFEEGRRFTEDLLRENERLRALNAQIRTEKRDLETQYVRVDVPSMQRKLALLEEEVRNLRAENADLKSQFVSVEEENREFATRYVDVERQNSDLINLYVASHRLHSTLDYGEVVAIIKEIIINMVGSELFGIYALDEKRNCLVLIGHEGLENDAAASIPLGEGTLGRAAQSGETYVAPEGTALHERGQEPIAVIPLKVGERSLGVIGIYRLLAQKEAFHSVDLELFELLGGHAATALYVTKLYAASERKRNTLEGFIDLLKTA